MTADQQSSVTYRQFVLGVHRDLRGNNVIPSKDDLSMTKPHRLLRGHEYQRAKNSSGFLCRPDAILRGFAAKMWDPAKPDKMHHLTQPPLTTSRAETRKTKPRNPRVLRGFVRAARLAVRQNSSSPQVRQAIREGANTDNLNPVDPADPVIPSKK